MCTFRSGFITKILYAVLFTHMRTSRTVYHILVDFITFIIFGEYSLLKCWLHNFIYSHLTSSLCLIVPHLLLSALFSSTLSVLCLLYLFLNTSSSQIPPHWRVSSLFSYRKPKKMDRATTRADIFWKIHSMRIWLDIIHTLTLLQVRKCRLEVMLATLHW
jgi:hypothetical protein